MLSKLKILVVFYSQSGHTERVAKDIAGRLNADVERITDLKNRNGFWGFLYGGRDAMQKRPTEIEKPVKDPALYDLVIIGTPLWAWNMAPAVRAYIEMTRGKLKNAAFFVTSATSAPDRVQGYMEELSGKKAAAFLGFVESEMKNEGVYTEKVGKFVAEVKK